MEKELLHKNGLIIIKKFFEKERIDSLRESAKDIFNIQFQKLKYNSDFKHNMIRLFNEENIIFQNCGKLIQSGLIELYNLAYDNRLINKLKDLGLEKPLVCTRPVLYFNHEKLAKEKRYYKTPPHQDYPSMLSSSDSVVIWIPLIDVHPENGAVVFYPESHKLGPLTDRLEDGFAKVEIPNDYKRIQPSLEIGDIVIFSTLLIHESGDIANDEIRWSCHFRYTNMLDQDFINRGFPSPYIYKSIV